MNLLSRPEELILLAVWRLQDEAYGAPIRDLLSDQTDLDWPIASVYQPLKRLAKKGFLTSHVGPPTPERGGRGKRFYRLTAKGKTALNRVRAIDEVMWSGVQPFPLKTSQK